MSGFSNLDVGSVTKSMKSNVFQWMFFGHFYVYEPGIWISKIESTRFTRFVENENSLERVSFIVVCQKLIFRFYRFFIVVTQVMDICLVSPLR